MSQLREIIFWIAALYGLAAQAAVSVTDDVGKVVKLEHTAKRIVSLAPHITELLYAAGAGDFIVGAVEYSDYPPAAKKIPRVGSHSALDLERILALKPDLVVAWQSGTKRGPVQRLRQMGIPVYASEPHSLEDIANSVRQLGRLAGTEERASAVGKEFLARRHALRARYGMKNTVSVFYQVWHQPLMTVNGKHVISQVIALCGGRNVFAELSALAPKVSLEAVLAKNPQVIVGGNVSAAKPNWKADWEKWPQLRAVKNGHIFYVNPDHLQRHTPRILLGAEELCEKLDRVRAELTE